MSGKFICLLLMAGHQRILQIIVQPLQPSWKSRGSDGARLFKTGTGLMKIEGQLRAINRRKSPSFIVQINIFLQNYVFKRCNHNIYTRL